LERLTLPSSALDDDDDLSPAIQPHQLAAAAVPATPIAELVSNFCDLMQPEENGD
jgi:hypothetical protein